MFARVARGELQLSVLCELGKYLNSENATALFEACGGKSYELALELLAARFPKPDVRDSIRRMPVRAANFTPDIECAPAAVVAGGKALDLPGPADRVNVPDSPVISGAATLATAPMRRALEPLSADRFGVRFTADTEFRELLEEVRALASHRDAAQGQGDGDLLSLMKRGLEAYRRELQKERFGVGSKPRLVPSQRAESGEPPGRSRHVPAAVAREVYLRDGGCCTFCSEAGHRCGARRFLELDHVRPWAAGGESTVANMRLRCRAHNQQAARDHFGEGFVNAAIARARVKQEPGKI